MSTQHHFVTVCLLPIMIIAGVFSRSNGKVVNQVLPLRLALQEENVTWVFDPFVCLVLCRASAWGSHATTTPPSGPRHSSLYFCNQGLPDSHYSIFDVQRLSNFPTTCEFVSEGLTLMRIDARTRTRETNTSSLTEILGED